jgi:hypothetical protein
MTPDQFNNLFAISWSRSQDCFHIQTIEELVFANWDIFFGRNPNDSDWLVLGFASTHADASAYIEKLKRDLDDPSFGSEHI